MNARLAPLQARWRALAPRERVLVGAAAALLGLYLVFALAIQPAWRTLRSAPAQLDALEAEWQAHLDEAEAAAEQARAEAQREAPCLSYPSRQST